MKNNRYLKGLRVPAVVMLAGVVMLSACASGTSSQTASSASGSASASAEASVASSTAASASTSSATTSGDCAHVDANKDCKCDKCGNALTHTDLNNDEVCDYCGEGAPIFTFIASSDTHVGPAKANSQFDNFLNIVFHGNSDIQAMDTLLIGGDLVDDADEDYWKSYTSIVNKQAAGKNIYTIPGNHDGDGVEMYVSNTNYGGVGYENSVYKASGDDDYWIQMLSVDIGTGDHKYRVIGLGNDYNLYWDGQGQALEWLEAQIQDAIEKNGESAPIFVMTHSGVKETAAGTWGGWLDNEKGGPLDTILEKYPNVISLGGHTHENMECPGNNYSEGGAHFFNTASVFYLTESTGENKKVCYDGNNSQAYVVEVYSDRVVLKGYNFSAQRWIIESENFGYADVDDPRLEVDTKYGYEDGQVPICYTTPVDSVYTVYMPEEK